MKDLLNGYKQHAPYQIEIEPTEGCNLGCNFCGLKGIREKGTKPWKYMTVDIARDAARKIRKAGWKSSICFCGHGEPTLNENLLEIIKVFREELPNNIMSLVTNGYGFKHGIFNINEFFDELEKLHFNDVIFDVYSDNGDWTAIEDITDRYDIKIIGRDGEKYNYYGKKMRVSIYPLEVDKTGRLFRIMDNHCGAASPQDFSERRVNKRCQKPFRLLFIRWNSQVCLCCDDFRGQYKIGKVTEFDKIDDLWNSPAFQAARIQLFIGKRTFKPCYGCNYSPVRAGLLPDPCAKDKDVMPKKLSKEVIEVLRNSYDEKGSTTIVMRKWENKETFKNN